MWFNPAVFAVSPPPSSSSMMKKWAEPPLRSGSRRLYHYCHSISKRFSLSEIKCKTPYFSEASLSCPHVSLPLRQPPCSLCILGIGGKKYKGGPVYPLYLCTANGLFRVEHFPLMIFISGDHDVVSGGFHDFSVCFVYLFIFIHYLFLIEWFIEESCWSLLIRRVL